MWSPVTDDQGERILLGSTPDLPSEEGMKALEAAKSAYDHGRGAWPTAPAADRIAAMEKFIELMVPKRDEVVNLLMWEICKKRSDAEKEFDRTVTYLRETIDEYKNLHREGSHIMQVNGTLAQIRRGPIGVVLCLGPFNYPLNETFCVLLPALLMGNVRVQACQVRCFAHYAAVGGVRKELPARCGEHHLRPRPDLGLAYHANRSYRRPCADRQQQVKQCAHQSASQAEPGASGVGPRSEKPSRDLPRRRHRPRCQRMRQRCLSFNGQRCTALKVIYVHKDIRDAFLKAFAAATDALEWGSPFDNADITPLPEVGKVGYMQDYVKEAVEAGARVVTSAVVRSKAIASSRPSCIP